MITNFKLYENLSFPPKIGDYVILDNSRYGFELFRNFKGIGQVLKTEKEHGGTQIFYIVKFENIPIELSYNMANFFYKDNTRKCSLSNFECWSENKEELEMFLSTKKYNL